MGDAATMRSGRAHCFTTTRWSIVLASAEPDGGNESADALAELCRTYWRPVFAYICRRGCNVTDAQDLTQGFFLKILEGGLLQRANPQRGRFRALLLHALKNFLVDGRLQQSAQKRGGGLKFISWDEFIEEAPAGNGATPHALSRCSADRLFDVRWAATVVEQAQWRLGEECERIGRRRLFDAVRCYLSADRGEVCYATVASELGVKDDAFKRLLHRMRLRYRELLRDEVAQTVVTPDEIDDELRYLCSALSVETE